MGRARNLSPPNPQGGAEIGNIEPAIARRLKLMEPKMQRSGKLFIIPDFGVLLDISRDANNVPRMTQGFIPRGMARATRINYLWRDANGITDQLATPAGTVIARDDHHLFITTDQWDAYLVDCAMKGITPTTPEGFVPITHWRDAHKTVYTLKSFRQLVMLHYRR